MAKTSGGVRGSRRPKTKAERLKVVLRNQRKRIKDYAKSYIVGKSVKHNAIDKPIHFSMRGIKEALNQPHKHILYKNMVVRNIDKVLPKAKFLKTDNDSKGRKLKYHYLEMLINKENSFIVLKENQNKVYFHTITDKMKK